MSKSLFKQLFTVGTFVICAFSLAACNPSKKQTAGKKRGSANRSLTQAELVQGQDFIQAAE
jgi:hypothetical protein